MSERNTYAPGTPSWVDLGTSDPAAAAAFYSGLFGWDIQEGPPEAGGYRMCLFRGRPVAGLGPSQSEGMPPWWTTYVAVSSADETAAAISANGGTVLVPPMDVLDVGRMAVAADPYGAVISVWQAGTHHAGARQRTGHALLERAEHPPPGGAHRLLHRGVRLGGQAVGGPDELHRVQPPRRQHRRNDGDGRHVSHGGARELERLLRGGQLGTRRPRRSPNWAAAC